jgi:hypothetical protein
MLSKDEEAGIEFDLLEALRAVTYAMGPAPVAQPDPMRRLESSDLVSIAFAALAKLLSEAPSNNEKVELFISLQKEGYKMLQAALLELPAEGQA